MNPLTNRFAVANRYSKVKGSARESPSGKATGSDPVIRGFDPLLPSRVFDMSIGELMGHDIIKLNNQ